MFVNGDYNMSSTLTYTSSMLQYASLKEDLCGYDVEKLKVWMGHLKYCFCLHLGFLIHIFLECSS